MEQNTGQADSNNNRVQLDPVMDAMIESMIVINDRGQIEQANKATTTMFGYPMAELIGANVAMLMPGPDSKRHDQHLERYNRTGRKRIIGKGREVQALRKDGTEFPADIAVGEIHSGGIVRYVGLIRDLTSQRQAEEEALRQREEMVNVSRLSMMGEMAAAMAHELNQPLTAIANFSAASIRMLESDADAHKNDVLDALRDIYSEAHRAGEVIRRTRSFTRTTDSDRQINSLGNIAAQVRSLAQLDTRANNIRLHWDLPADLPPVEVDPVQIQQVILNLIRNAVDAMEATPPEHRHIYVRALLTAPHEIRFEVRDQGSGVKVETTHQIFNAFFTTKMLGMGMGLAICRTIIRTHGGELGFRNNDKDNAAAGATFYFTLPTQVKA